MSAGATALVIVAIIAAFVMVAIFARLADNNQTDKDVHHTRLLEELKRQPHNEQDEL